MVRAIAETELGTFIAEGDENGVTRIWLPGTAPDELEPTGEMPWSFEKQIRDYLDGKRRDWNLPYSLCGTPFRVAVWAACRDIPYGETRTYGELAEIAGYPGAARAVGSAMAANPLPLIIPCHRVLPASGGIGSYGGGKALKAALLELENSTKKENE